MSYAELLKDPRWQKKRLEIMERDEWTCKACGDTKATLTVHHKSYRMVDGKFVDIWDYPGDDLITLCEECHSQEEENLDFIKKNVFFALRNYCEDSYAISHILQTIKETNIRCERRINTADAVKFRTAAEENIHKIRVFAEGASLSDMLAKLMNEGE